MCLFFAVKCPKGTFQSSSDLCLPCPRGKYQPMVGQVSCLPCPQNTNTLPYNTLARSVESCIGKIKDKLEDLPRRVSLKGPIRQSLNNSKKAQYFWEVLSANENLGCDHLQLVSCICNHLSLNESILKKKFKNWFSALGKNQFSENCQKLTKCCDQIPWPRVNHYLWNDCSYL